MLTTCTLNTCLKEANWETEGSHFSKILRKHMAEGNGSTGHSNPPQQILLCLCTSSDTHTRTHTTTTAKEQIIFCCFIQQKQRSTKQRMRSKTHTSQLTVQLQPNPQCCLGHLCCTCPKTEFKKKHSQGQGQCPVQSSRALKKALGFPSQGTGA